ncbi:MAG: hypothetical protein U1E06_10395 [Tabrizicola sp.]|nr:hypothetical protein [Tabrizicola sp.]
MPTLIPIADGPDRNCGSIIFVHGLGGDPWKTWGDRFWPRWLAADRFWPRWLAEEPDLATLAVYTLKYEAAPSELTGSSMSLVDHGENILAVLKCRNALLGAPIAFICHSLGGLVLKQVLRAAQEEADRDRCARQLLDQIAQVVFIATPHRGTKLPVLIEKYVWFAFRPTIVMKSLREGDEPVLNLARWYTNFCGSDHRTIPHLVFRETKKTRRMMVVSEASSDPGVPSESVPIPANHIDICKPKDRHSEVYASALKLLKNLAFACPGPIPDRISKLYDSDPVPDRRRIVEQIRGDLRQHDWRLDTMEKGQGCTNPDFNLKLVATPPFIRIRRLNGRWAAYKRDDDPLRIYALAKTREKSGDFFNGRKIRIASDFIGQSSVAIQETDYLSSLMTDQLAWLRVYSKKLSADGMTPEEFLWDGRTAFVEADATISTSRLKGFGEALISNQLGASTLAFSSDGHLMIVAQSDKNLQSVNWLAPSGSGSLDWSDVAASQACDLLSLARYGAERELREECALDDCGGPRRIASKVMVTGFVRMLHRAGKPEFFCLGRIGAPSDEICNRKPERYVESVFRAPVTCANWHVGRPRDQIDRVCQDYLEKIFRYKGGRVPLSYPLEHALKLLIEACRDDRAAVVLDRFMQTDFE